MGTLQFPDLFLPRKSLLFETGLNLFLTGGRGKEFMTAYEVACLMAALKICIYFPQSSSHEVQSVLFLKSCFECLELFIPIVLFSVDMSLTLRVHVSLYFLQN